VSSDDRDFGTDSDFDADFDTDHELRAVLRSGDPAASLPAADQVALAGLLEDIMSADLDIRPVADDGTRAAGTRGRNRLTWLVAAAAVAMIAGVGGVAVSGLAGDDSAPPSARETTGPGSTELTSAAPLAGQTTELTLTQEQAQQVGRCASPDSEILAQYTQAFAGTVTAIEGDTVTLQTTEVFQGEVGETVHVTAPPPLFDTLLDAVRFQEGRSYLVAAYDGQVSVCYSGPATEELRSPFEKAFLH
jgi:hypothetical protein